MLSVNEAKQRILAKLPEPGSEQVPVAEAAGRVCAADAVARRALPPYDNSAMDGFAVRSTDLPGTLPVAGTIAAGDNPDRELPAGQVLRIMTGAPMPRGADAVVMRENVNDHGDTAEFAEPAIVARHIRRAGEDVAVGDVVVSAGADIDPGAVGLLAAQGFATVAVTPRPRVAIISTGDELVDVGVEPGPGQIVNSNAYALAAQIHEFGGVPVDLGIAADDLDASIAVLKRSLDADMVVTCGGVSVGDFDFVKQAFEAVDIDVDFWKVAIKPGKPLVFGLTPSGAPVLGLPGNPVSAMVTFEVFGRPLVRALMGADNRERPRVPVELGRGVRKKPGRAHYLRARLRRDGGRLIAEPHSKQGSGMLSSMLDVDALVIIPADAGDQPEGTSVEAVLLRPV